MGSKKVLEPKIHSFTEYVREMMYETLKKLLALEKIADPEGIHIKLDFLPVKTFYKEDRPYIFVPVGTKDKPAGISLKDYKLVMTINKNEIIHIFHVDTLRQYIKINRRNLEYKIDKYYEVMGFNVSVDRLVAFEIGAEDYLKNKEKKEA